MKRAASALLSLMLGLLAGIVLHYMLYRMGLSQEPFIYVAF